MPDIIDDETREIIVSFIAEGYERLDDAEAELEKLDASVEGGVGEDAENIRRLNSVFRLFHSVKGSAGYLNFEYIKALTHEAEALLEVFIKGGLKPTPESFDVIFKTIDVLRELVKMVEHDLSDKQGAAIAKDQASSVAAYALALKSKAGIGAKSGVAVSGSTTAANAPQRPSNEIILSELVSADMVERFLAECADLVDGAEKNALAFESGADSVEGVNTIFRAIHTIKGNAGFFGYILLESLSMEFEAQLEGVRKGGQALNEAFIASIMSHIDGLRSAMGSVAIIPAGSAPELRKESHATEDRARTPVIESADTEEAAPYKPIGQILIDMGATPEEEVKRALEIRNRPLGEILVESGAVKPNDLAVALETQRKSQAAERPAVEDVARKEIRVDTSKLDKLFELVGELITAEAMVGNSPELVGLKLDEFQKAFSSLGKISREIQETTMMIRMIPLEGLFQKMTRLVRDLSRKMEKPIDFRVSGAETEMDKNVIEQVSDPLVHILRNSLDHGIESPDKRAAAGKRDIGTLHLDARYEGSEIWISVKDDGAGLNREKILAKAIERGLVEGDPAALDDETIYGFIFQAGFSTAAKVTEISGRGVGLDVVTKNLEKIRGAVDIKSEPGKGTEFILKIPLTMAIIDGITIRVGSGVYSIPLGDIIEFFKVTPGQLTVTESGEITVNLRGAILPLVKLGEVFNIKDALLEPTEGIILVVESGDMKACLLIDEVVGNQQIVVKSISEYLGKVEGISGCSILGDGRVSFIIDTARLVARRIEQK
ncbi:MAG: chemotaxis protein CheA [Spirochaetota bacterium]